MPNTEHLAQRAGQLRAEQVYWQGVKQRANTQLQDIPPGDGLYTDNAQEQLKSQIAAAAYHLEMIAQELNRIARQEEEQAREEVIGQQTKYEQAPGDRDVAQPEHERKEELAGEERAKAEALQKEQEQKEQALEKERQDKEFFENKERERLEALEKEERARQEIEKQELLKKEEMQKEGQSELDFLGEQLMDINQEWQYVLDQIDSEWQYVDDQINEEMEYNVEQTIEVVAEVVGAIALEIRDPVSERKSGKFLEEKAKELEAFMRTEDFQGQSADTKARFLEDRIKEQIGEAKEQFGDRVDEFGNREKLMEQLAAVHDIAREAVEREKEIEKQALEKIEQLKKIEAENKERIENSDRDKERIARELELLAELTKRQEQMIRDEAEKRAQALYEQKLLEEERERERQRQIEAASAARAASLQF